MEMCYMLLPPLYVVCVCDFLISQFHFLQGHSGHSETVVQSSSSRFCFVRDLDMWAKAYFHG